MRAEVSENLYRTLMVTERKILDPLLEYQGTPVKAIILHQKPDSLDLRSLTLRS